MVFLWFSYGFPMCLQDIRLVRCQGLTVRDGMERRTSSNGGWSSKVVPFFFGIAKLVINITPI